MNYTVEIEYQSYEVISNRIAEICQILPSVSHSAEYYIT